MRLTIPQIGHPPPVFQKFRTNALSLTTLRRLRTVSAPPATTAVYPTLTPKMAMKIGGKYKFSEVQARHWEQ